ncbi:HAMP domain-containing histidine kinase [bacterium]|nr:HAMP domain-containing histidine kinase [bacterium]
MIDFIKNLFVKDEEEEDLLTKLPDSVVLLNNQGSFLWFNDLAQKNLSNLKDNFSEGYIDDIFENAMELIVKIADKEKTTIVRTKSKLEKDMFFELSARHTDEGFLVIMRNNTQNYKTLTSILVEHESSKKVNRDKNNFLVKLSGEFKTPLQSVIGFSQAVLDGLGGDISEKQEKYVSIINKNSEEVLSLFNRILDLSKSESNLFEHKLSYFDAINVLNDVIKANNAEIEAKDLTLNVNVSSDIKRTIYSDEQLLKLILQNIVEIAVKYTDVGDITINVKHPELELVNDKGLVPFENANEKSFLMITVKDMGLGISEAELDTLFEPYAQLDSPNKKNIIRSIAFATIKNVIKMLKGNMWVDTEAMQGTTYNVIIPTEKVMQTGNE